MSQDLIFAISTMKGGGAERVLSLLANQMHDQGYDVEMLLTSSRSSGMEYRDLKEEIPVHSLQKGLEPDSPLEKLYYSLTGGLARCLCRLLEGWKLRVPAGVAYASFQWLYHREIKAMRQKLKQQPGTTVLAFLQPAVPIVLLAARGLPNRVVVSERGSAARLMESRYGYPFVKRYYHRADGIVFQSAQAMQTYPQTLEAKGQVIANPVKTGLPVAYQGERRKAVVTFCRICTQKNLPLLIRAFAAFHQSFPDYTLEIYGDPQDEADKRLQQELSALVKTLQASSAIFFLPASPRIHYSILDAAMYVNSSDFEGMSNAMLEAMSIGLPVICTDCPSGGAAAIIRDHENGILVPMQDEKALCTAMAELAENPALCQKISIHAQQLRQTLAIEEIAKQWEDVLSGTSDIEGRDL